MLLGQDAAEPHHLPYPEDALEQAVIFYKNTLRQGIGLYNGGEYSFKYPDIKGTPFFEGQDWKMGTIVYGGQVYKNVHMKLDNFKDLLVINYYDSKGYFHYLQLITERIERFGWDGHNFIYLKTDSLRSPGMRSGFYDVLYDGGVRVLARYAKTIQKNDDFESQTRKFAEKEYYFIENKGNIVRIRNKSSVRQAFADREKEIRAYLKKQKIKLKIRPAKELAAVAAYYDEINEE